MKVKKPFDPSMLEEVRKQIENNEEDEEKPIKTTSETTEESHGGQESTQSIPNSPNPSDDTNQKPNEEDGSEKSEKNAYGHEEESNGESGDELQNEGEPEEDEQIDSDGGEELQNEDEDNNDDESDNEAQDGAESQNYNNEDADEKNDSGSDEDEDNNNEEEDEDDDSDGESDDESQNDNNGDYEENESGDNCNKDGDISGNDESQEEDNDYGDNKEESEDDNNDGESDGDEENGQNNEDNNNDDEDDNGESESDDANSNADEDNSVGTYNTREVVQLDNPFQSSVKYVQTEFYRFIEKIAEDKTKIFTDDTGEYLNVKRLMLRPYERKPLSYYYQDKVRDTVVLVLDNSGSMNWWAYNLHVLAKIALSRGDVEIYIAPNGEVVALLTKKGRMDFDHDEFMKTMQGRKIIYVGDFDGANTPVQLSWRNDVIWICPETRYRRFQSHDWVNYSEDAYKGVFIRAYDLQEMFKAFRQITRFYKLWIDFHESDDFKDDEGDGND